MPEHTDDQGRGDGGGRDHAERQIGPEEAAFAQRVAELGDRLGRVARRRGIGGGSGGAEPPDVGGRGARPEATGQAAAGVGRGMAYGMRLASELVAAVVVGGLLGVGLDKWLGTWPWLFLVFFLLGFGAGVRNVVRATSALAQRIANDRRGNG
jgi:ATP synthase protein I